MSAMCKGWQASGIHVWSEEECTLFLQTGQMLYSLGGSSTDHACLTSGYVQTALSADAAASATTISVDSVTGIANGYHIGIQVDAGTNFWTTVNGAPSGTTVTLTNAMPSQATQGAFVFSYGTPLMRPLRVYGRPPVHLPAYLGHWRDRDADADDGAARLRGAAEQVHPGHRHAVLLRSAAG